MRKILVAYATMAGSTAEVAEIVGEEIVKSGLQVDILPIEQVKDLQNYDGVVVGAPMIMGWHRDAEGDESLTTRCKCECQVSLPDLRGLHRHQLGKLRLNLSSLVESIILRTEQGYFHGLWL